MIIYGPTSPRHLTSTRLHHTQHPLSVQLSLHWAIVSFIQTPYLSSIGLVKYDLFYNKIKESWWSIPPPPISCNLVVFNSIHSVHKMLIEFVPRATFMNLTLFFTFFRNPIGPSLVNQLLYAIIVTICETILGNCCFAIKKNGILSIITLTQCLIC